MLRPHRHFEQFAFESRTHYLEWPFVWFTIILPHWVIFELIPHQDAPHIGMTVEANAVQIEDFSLLKFCAAPNGSERRQPRFSCAISSAHSNNHRPMFLRDRVEVINGFEITENCLLLGFFHFLF